jgi:hypothetical protein
MSMREKCVCSFPLSQDRLRDRGGVLCIVPHGLLAREMAIGSGPDRWHSRPQCHALKAAAGSSTDGENILARAPSRGGGDDAPILWSW